MSQIEVNINNLTTRTTTLKNASERFVQRTLSYVDNRSTLSIVKNSFYAHEQTNLAHLDFSRYLLKSASLIEEIGEGFFELDTTVANTIHTGIQSR